MRTHNKSTYTEKLKKHIGEPQNGRSDYFNLTHEQTIEMIKENLKDNFSSTLWTLDMGEEQLKYIDESLTKNGIIHCFDEAMDGFICFKNESDMKKFYDDLRKSMSEEDLNKLKKINCNTPLIKWYEQTL